MPSNISWTSLPHSVCLCLSLSLSLSLNVLGGDFHSSQPPIHPPVQHYYHCHFCQNLCKTLPNGPCLLFHKTSRLSCKPCYERKRHFTWPGFMYVNVYVCVQGDRVALVFFSKKMRREGHGRRIIHIMIVSHTHTHVHIKTHTRFFSLIFFLALVLILQYLEFSSVGIKS
jgi:hypothetical protein